MTMQDWLDILKAIKDDESVKISFTLMKDRKLVDLIDSLGGRRAAYEYFQEVDNSEPAEIGEIDENNELLQSP